MPDAAIHPRLRTQREGGGKSGKAKQEASGKLTEDQLLTREKHTLGDGHRTCTKWPDPYQDQRYAATGLLCWLGRTQRTSGAVGKEKSAWIRL